MLKGLFSAFILLQSGERRGGLPCLRRYAVNILRWTSPLKSVDRLTPMGNAEHRQRPSPYEWHRRRCRHHKTEWLPSVFRGALPDKDFYDRPLTHRLNSIHLKEQCRNDGPFRSTSLRHTSFLSGLHRFFFFQCSSPSPPPSGRRRFMFSWAFIRGSLFNKTYHQQVGQYELLALT